MPSRRSALAAVVAANLIWAGSYVAGKAALDDVPFVTLNALRFTLAALVLLPIVWRNRAALPSSRGGRLRLLAIAGFGFCGNKALEFLGLSLTTATDTALLITSESLVTLVLAVVLLGERLRLRTAAALAIGALGVYMLIEGGLVAPHLTGDKAVGDALVVASLALESVATVSGASLMRQGAPFTVTAAAVLLCVGVWAPAEVGYALHAGAVPHLGAAGWAGIVYLALAATCVGYGAWFWGLQRLSAQDITPLLLLQPVAGTVIATVVRGERPGVATLAGGALVLVAVGLSTLRRAQSQEEAALHAMAPEAP